MRLDLAPGILAPPAVEQHKPKLPSLQAASLLPTFSSDHFAAPHLQLAETLVSSSVHSFSPFASGARAAPSRAHRPLSCSPSPTRSSRPCPDSCLSPTPSLLRQIHSHCRSELLACFGCSRLNTFGSPARLLFLACYPQFTKNPSLPILEHTTLTSSSSPPSSILEASASLSRHSTGRAGNFVRSPGHQSDFVLFVVGLRVGRTPAARNTDHQGKPTSLSPLAHPRESTDFVLAKQEASTLSPGVDTASHPLTGRTVASIPQKEFSTLYGRSLIPWRGDSVSYQTKPI